MIPLAARRTCIVVADSVTQLPADVAGQVLVAGSHGGLIAGVLAARARVGALVLNDAGIGCDRAGVAALELLAGCNIAAATVARRSAAIGNGTQMLEKGVVSCYNALAAQAGVRVGMSCNDAALLLACRACVPTSRVELDAPLGRYLLRTAPQRVIGCDSICLVQPQDHDGVLIIGSHSALHAGPASALPVTAAAAFFHDAGSWGEPEGISRLPVLDLRGTPAAAVHYKSARIGDARSMFITGRLSFCNETAQQIGWRSGLSVQAALDTLVCSSVANLVI